MLDNRRGYASRADRLVLHLDELFDTRWPDDGPDPAWLDGKRDGADPSATRSSDYYTPRLGWPISDEVHAVGVTFIGRAAVSGDEARAPVRVTVAVDCCTNVAIIRIIDDGPRLSTEVDGPLVRLLRSWWCLRHCTESQHGVARMAREGIGLGGLSW